MTGIEARDALTKVPSGMAAKLLGLDDVRQLYTLQKRGEIECERTRTGRCLWDVAGYMERKPAEKRARRAAMGNLLQEAIGDKPGMTTLVNTASGTTLVTDKPKKYLASGEWKRRPKAKAA